MYIYLYIHRYTDTVVDGIMTVIVIISKSRMLT